MDVKPQTFSSYLTRARISDDVLARLSKAVQFDIRAMLGTGQPGYLTANSVVNQDLPPYGPNPTSRQAKGYTLTVPLYEYNDLDQLRIIKFLQSLPKTVGTPRSGMNE